MRRRRRKRRRRWRMFVKRRTRLLRKGTAEKKSTMRNAREFSMEANVKSKERISAERKGLGADSR